MDIFQLLITLIFYGLIFWLILWGISFIGIPEPFNKVIKVVLVVAVLIVLIGLLTGHVSPLQIKI